MDSNSVEFVTEALSIDVIDDKHNIICRDVSDVVLLVGPWRIRYKLGLRYLAEMSLMRGFEFIKQVLFDIIAHMCYNGTINIIFAAAVAMLRNLAAVNAQATENRSQEVLREG